MEETWFEELERLSEIGNDMGNVDVHVANKVISETMRKYEKENKKMSNTENLKNDFVKTFKEGVENFVGWTKASEEVLKVIDEFNKVTNSVLELNDSLEKFKDRKVKSLTTFEFDLEKEGIDVSEWEETVKPVKAIVSAMIKTDDDNHNISIEIGNIAMLMEDGSFEAINN